MMSLEEAKKDVAELRSLASKTSRPRVREMLEAEARRLEGYLDGWGNELARSAAAHRDEAKKQQALFEQTVQSVREMERHGAESHAKAPSLQKDGSPGASAAVQEARRPQTVPAPTPVPAPLPNAPAPPEGEGIVRKEFRDFDAIQMIEDTFEAKEVTVYVVLEGVGEFKEKVRVKFTLDQVEIVLEDGPRGLNYRRRISPLFKDVHPKQCSFKVLKNKVKLTLAKEKGTAGSDLWTTLTAKKPRTEADRAKKYDPSTSIMNMMEDLYEDADEKTRALIGEAMYKSRTGEGLDPDRMGGRNGRANSARSRTGGAATSSSAPGDPRKWPYGKDEEDEFEEYTSSEDDDDELLKM